MSTHIVDINKLLRIEKTLQDFIAHYRDLERGIGESQDGAMHAAQIASEVAQALFKARERVQYAYTLASGLQARQKYELEG